MKKIFTLLGIALMLAACSDSGNAVDDAAVDDNAKENQTAADQENKEIESEQESKSNSEDTQTDDSEDNQTNSHANNDTGSDQQTSTNADKKTSKSPKLTDASTILEKASTAMGNVESLSIAGTVMSDTTINGERRKEDTTVEGDIFLGEPMNLHQKIYLSNSDTNLEMYLTDDDYYVKENEKWITMPADYAENNLYNTVLDKQLRAYADYGSYFQVTLDDSHYILMYEGTDEEFKEVVFETGKIVLNEFFRDFFHNMQLSGIYEITIDKGTFQLTKHSLRYEGATSGAAGEGRIHEKSEFTYTSFDSLNQLTVPEDVIQSAEPVN